MSTKHSAFDNQKSNAFIEAINRAFGTIEFSPEGIVIDANKNFLELMGYSIEEIKGKHHRIFLNSNEAASPEYSTFWSSLAEGKINSGQFERITKDGKSVWLEASYNPVYDSTGKVTQIVKVATDITSKVMSDKELATVARNLNVALEETKVAERVREEMDRTLQAMSTPIMPIWEEILLLPLVGVVDSVRTDDVMRKSLEMISETGSKMFILDISGVPTVDTAVANQLLKITQATKFMGCETIVSGLSPAIARTMVDLGINVGDVRTTASLRDAFRISLSQVSTKV